MAFARKVSSELVRALRYNAKEGRIVIVRRLKKEDGSWDNTPPEDITDSFRAIFDLKNVGSCWLTFSKEVGPQVFNLMAMNRWESDHGRKPGKEFKEGFRVLCKLDEKFEDGPFIREILSNTGVLRDGLSDAHTAYEAGVRSHPGQLPILILDGKTEVEVFEGIAFRPIFKIDGWAPRPEGLPDLPPMREETALPSAERRGENNEAVEAAYGRAAGSSGRAASGGGYSGGFGSGGARREPGNNDDMNDDIPFAYPAIFSGGQP